MNEKPSYAAGVLGGYAGDALLKIQRRYFRRFPIDLPHDQEQSVEFLANVNDNAPDKEEEVVDFDNLTPVEVEAMMERIKERRKLIEFRKAVSYVHVCARGGYLLWFTSKSSVGLLINS